MGIGIDSFAAFLPDQPTGVPIVPASERMRTLLKEIVADDQAGLAVFGLGEHHRREFLDSAPAVILAAAAALTFQMSAAALPHARPMHAIELLGSRVAPLARSALGATAPKHDDLADVS